MNIRKIVTYNNLRKQFTVEELAFADALLNASDSDRELLITALQPEKSSTKKKSSKKGAGGGGKSQRASSIATTLGKNRQSQEPRCVACYEIRDHANHDLDNGGHEFQSSVSERAAKTLKKYEGLCAHETEQGLCDKPKNDSIHDPTMGYGGYHEFQPGRAQAAGGD